MVDDNGKKQRSIVVLSLAEFYDKSLSLRVAQESREFPCGRVTWVERVRHLESFHHVGPPQLWTSQHPNHSVAAENLGVQEGNSARKRVSHAGQAPCECFPVLVARATIRDNKSVPRGNPRAFGLDRFCPTCRGYFVSLVSHRRRGVPPVAGQPAGRWTNSERVRVASSYKGGDSSQDAGGGVLGVFHFRVSVLILMN